ncbi:MAG: sporulation protein YqfD [Lachnospiraceae bacterium]|nr:sporulation protein YqfD [Lachnospiraceae bacterium]
MLKFFQYIHGYLIIKVWGFSPERFMNLASHHQLFLWDIENHGDFYLMCISLRDFYKLKPITKKTGTRVAIQKRCGLPFYVPKVKRRKFFAIGLLLSLSFWIWMSAFIWAIEIRGNFHLTNDVLMRYLSGQGLVVGIRRKEVDLEKLEKSLRNEYDIITWTSARINGTRLIVQIKENELREPEEISAVMGDEKGFDLVAGKDGVIVSIITRSGVPLVIAGSEVLEGDILVQGGVPIFNDDLTVRNYQYYEADADIYLLTDFNHIEILPIDYKEKIYSGNEAKVPYIEILGKRIKFGFGRHGFEMFDIIDENKQIRLLENFYLPLFFGSELARDYQIEEKKYSSEEAKEIFTEAAKKIIENLREKGVQIIEKNVTMRKDNVNWYLDIEFEIIEKTGKSIPTSLYVEPVEPEELAETIE